MSHFFHQIGRVLLTLVLVISVLPHTTQTAKALNYYPYVSFEFEDGLGTPLVGPLQLRISLWSRFDVKNDDVQVSGALNTSSSFYGGFQTSLVVPALDIKTVAGRGGLYRLYLPNVPGFPSDLDSDSAYLQVEVMDPPGGLDTDYVVYDFFDDPPHQVISRLRIFEDTSSIDRDPGQGTFFDDFAIDNNDDSTTEIRLVFGRVLNESLNWDVSNDYFFLSDSLVVDGNLNLQGTTIRLDSDESGDPDQDVQIIAPQGSETDGVIRFDDGDNRWEISEQGLLVENFGAGLSFRVDDQVADTTPFVIDEVGEVGIGTASPTFNFHLFDTGSSLVTEWIGMDDGTNQVSILSGTQNPKLVATDADVGSLFLNSSTGAFYIKQDDGVSVQWNLGGLTDNINNALQGTFGTPSGTNRFVTDQDPRLSATSGGFGETALGTRLDYEGVKKISRSHIIYTRVFIPDESTVTSFAIYTTSSITGDINMGLYSSNAAGTAPLTRLAQTGPQVGVTSPVNGFWQFPISGGPYLTTSADFYWLAVAVTDQPFTKARASSEDSFVPYRLENKANGSTTLPLTPTLVPIGNVIDLPYLGAFE